MSAMIRWRVALAGVRVRSRTLATNKRTFILPSVEKNWIDRVACVEVYITNLYPIVGVALRGHPIVARRWGGHRGPPLQNISRVEKSFQFWFCGKSGAGAEGAALYRRHRIT